MEVGTPGILAGSREAFQGHSWVPALSTALAGSQGRRDRSRLSAAQTQEAVAFGWLSAQMPLRRPGHGADLSPVRGPGLGPSPTHPRLGQKQLKALVPRLACGVKNEWRSARLSFLPDQTPLVSISVPSAIIYLALRFT